MKPENFPQRLFVTGTDTDIGKTVVAAILLAGLGGVYWKPIQSGLEPLTDTDWIRQKTDLPPSHFQPEAYVFKTPVSPHLAAKIEGRQISLEQIQVPPVKSGQHLIIEGAGGILVPLNESQFMLDLIKKIEAPALVVAPSRLGMINQTLLTVEQLRQAGVKVWGVVINGELNLENKKAVEHYGQVPVVAEIEPMTSLTPQTLQTAFERFLS